LACTREP